MEIDTDASCTLMSEMTYESTYPCNDRPLITQLKDRVQTYTKECVLMLGEIIVTVSHNGRVKKLPLSIVKGSGPTLLGRDWLEMLKQNWSEVNMLRHMSCDHLLAQYDELFQEGLGQLKGVTAMLRVDKEITPRFYKARPVPYALYSKFSTEIE